MRTGLSKEHAIVIIEPSKGKQRASCDWSIANLSISGQDLSCLVPIWMNSRARWLNIENIENTEYWYCWDTRDTIKVILWMGIFLKHWWMKWFVNILRVHHDPWNGWSYMMMRFPLIFCTSGVSLQYCNIAIFEHCTDQVQQMRVFNAQLEKEMRAEKKKNRKMLEKVHICIILLLVKNWCQGWG